MGRRDVQGKAVLKTGPEQPPTLRARWGEGMGSDLPTHGLGNRCSDGNPPGFQNSARTAPTSIANYGAAQRTHQAGFAVLVLFGLSPLFIDPTLLPTAAAAAAAKSLQSCPTLCYPHRQQPARLLCPWDSPGKNTGVGCHFLLQCMRVKVKSLSRV